MRKWQYQATASIALTITAASIAIIKIELWPISVVLLIISSNIFITLAEINYKEDNR